MNVAWKTDTGNLRSNNQDAVLVDSDQGIFLLADGMGGHNAGEIASDLAVKEAYEFIKKEKGRAGSDRDVLALLEAALCSAHRAIKAKADADVRLYGMGTTLVELYIRDDNAYICHAGDSRAYLFRASLQRITRDHTVGDSYVERGVMEMERVPARLWHVLTQAVGCHECPVPDKVTVALRPGDILLLCSDGLTTMLTDDEMQDIVKQYWGSLSEMVNVLAGEANNKGGKDNISLIAVKH